MGQIKLDALTCDFCGKHQFEIRKLIAGPKVFICNECIDLCVQIINEDEVAAPPTTDDSKEAGQ